MTEPAQPIIRRAALSLSLGELAQRFGMELHGDAQLRIDAVAALQHAQPGCLTFLANPRYRKYVADTRATAVILAEPDRKYCNGAALVARSPYLAYARVLRALFPAHQPVAGVHPTAQIDITAQIDPSAEVQAYAVVGPRVQIGARVVVGAHSVIAEAAVLGDETVLHAQVFVGPGVQIGRRVVVQPGAVIGREGFGFANDGGCWVRVPQLGTVIIGDDCEVGANTTIDRGSLEDTVLGIGVKLDNLIQIAHNVHIGDHTAIAACVGIAGSTHIGRNCTIGGGTGINGHITLADGVHITGFTMVTKSLLTPGLYSSGVAVNTNQAWRRNHARFQQLDVLAKRLKTLEQRIGLESEPLNEDSGVD
jgi:UDP-3-O-[3-hydroxymyristoyl] glucosamine N-acyltransferase